jgi:choline dehydrogenase-like flavoprotein
MTRGHDFIIVGGGSAGCVLAARLSENPAASVLLLEAGGRDRHPFYHLPAGFAKMTKGIGSWGWSTVPQRHMGGMVIRYTQARVIGGGSAINAQIYTRGNALDYDEWRQKGCEGWGYEDVLPFFRKAEDNDTFENRYHGRGGPLGVSQPRAPLPICEAYFAAAAELGIPRNHDMAGERQDGVGYYQLTQRDGRRSSAAMAYLAPNRGRKNLAVRTGAQVRRIVVERGRATGVEMADGSRIAASGEVIVASGAIGSPRMLMLSGIGPAEHLAEVGIRPVHDRPEVGANLQDHLDLYTICEVTGPHSYDRYARLHWSAVAGLQYLLTKRGPVASSLFETGGFWFADEHARSPDIQLHLGLGTGIESGVASMPNGGVTLNACYLRPRSRGSVRLASADPAAAPLIDPNYWQDARDREMSIRGLKLAQEIMRQAPLRPFILAERLPGPDVRTDADYVGFICRNSKTSHHPAGTCRMGADPGAVVDPRLRLNGIEGLRVADASIMPTVVSSNTNAATIMIGEKAADMIRADHGL